MFPVLMVLSLSLMRVQTDWKPVAVWRTQGINALCGDLSRDGKLYALGSFDGSVSLLNTADGKVTATVKTNKEAIKAVAISSDGTWIAAGGVSPSLFMVKRETGKVAKTLPAKIGNGARSLAFSPDGMTLAVAGSGDFTSPTFIQLWDVSKGVKRKTLTNFPDGVTQMHFSRDGKSLFLGTLEEYASQNRASTGAPTVTYRGGKSMVSSIALDGAESLLLAGHDNATATLYDVKSGRKLQTFAQGHTSTVLNVALTRDGKFAATGGNDRAVVLWNRQTGKLLGKWKGEGAIAALHFSPNGKRLYAAINAVDAPAEVMVFAVGGK